MELNLIIEFLLLFFILIDMSNFIRFTCPACSSKLKVLEKHVGKTFKCNCGHRFSLNPTAYLQGKIIYENQKKEVIEDNIGGPSWSGIIILFLTGSLNGCISCFLTKAIIMLIG